MKDEEYYKHILARGNKILEQLVPELNKLSFAHNRKDPKRFRREEDCNEIALALGLYDEHLDSLLV